MGVILAGSSRQPCWPSAPVSSCARSMSPSYEAYSTGGTRVGDPGSNLVGPDWTGEPGGGSPVAEGEETRG
jgi:hypothetical protein